MSFLQALDVLYAVSGFAVGALVGLSGVGGGSLMTPLLVLLFGIHPSTAVGTDLLFAGLTKIVGTVTHGGHGTVRWRIVALLSCGSLPSAAATLLVVHSLGPWTETASRLISYALGMALLVTAVTLFFRDALIRRHAQTSYPPRRQALLTVATGAVIGALVSITSVGAGALGVFALYFLYPRLPARCIVGSDLAHAVPLTLVAGSGYWLLGSVDTTILVSLLSGSIPGVIIGSTIAPRLADGLLRPILATILLIVGGRTLLAAG